MIKFRNCHDDIRKRYTVPVQFDISATTGSKLVHIDHERWTKIKKIIFVYAGASNAATVTNLEVGTSSSNTQYLDQAIATGQSAWAVASYEPAATALLPKNTPLLVTSAGTAPNTAVVDVVVCYEPQDRPTI